MNRRTWLLLPCLVTLLVSACKDTAKISKTQASAHVAFLAEIATKDVAEVRTGLPQGADLLGAAWKADPAVGTDLKAAADALEVARRKVQDLRVAKSTFFALADDHGVVVRNDQEQDRMAGKALFTSFPDLTGAGKQYTETTGSMPEASGVRAPRADGQWIAGAPVKVDGVARGLYVTGWSWSSYAYHLEFALRGKIRSELVNKREENEPLLYVFVLVGSAVYGAPVSPDVSRTALAAVDPLAKAKSGETFTDTIEITGRAYGLAVQRVPALGQGVGIAVLRSET
ncbi:MAG TPA: hypothetical protein VF395_00665 [Polyangiaceae bacterium]